jgi:preprotein translocase subunit YajC
MQFDPLTIGLLGLLAVMIFFMFRSSRRRRRDAEEMQAKLLPGAEVMTQQGIYGTIVSIDDEKNEALIESTPGTVLRVHRQVIARVVDPTVDDETEEEAEIDALEESGAVADSEVPPTLSEPEYGERIDDTKPPRPGKEQTD